MSTQPTDALARVREKACSVPYVAETEALEHVMRGKPDFRWWMMVTAGAFEAEAMLRLADRRWRR